jgi:microcystin-dependent protein
MVLAMVQNWGGFAGQTWVQFAQGRTLVGQDSSDTAFDAVTPTAYIGEKEHILTIAEMPSHSHIEEGGGTTYHSSATYVAGTHPTLGLGYTDTDTASTGGDQAHNNVQPYEVVYYYKRTA